MTSRTGDPAARGARPAEERGQWRRPDWLRISLRTALHSDVLTEMEEYGWQCWCGRVEGLWSLDEVNDSDVPAGGCPDPRDRGWDDTEARVDEECLFLALGRITAHAIRFGDQPRTPGAGAIVDAAGLSEAADAISENLTATVCPLLDVSSYDDFTEEVLAVVGEEYVDELLVMDETELDPRVRGAGIGAWTDARVITALAPHPSTLIVAKAAPLHRSDFMPDDAERGRDLTAEESAAWQHGQQRLWEYWSRTLGLTRLKEGGLLVGLGGQHQARERTLASWSTR